VAQQAQNFEGQRSLPPSTELLQAAVTLLGAPGAATTRAIARAAGYRPLAPACRAGGRASLPLGYLPVWRGRQKELCFFYPLSWALFSLSPAASPKTQTFSPPIAPHGTASPQHAHRPEPQTTGPLFRERESV
jgi:hypothetical protein